MSGQDSGVFWLGLKRQVVYQIEKNSQQRVQCKTNNGRCHLQRPLRSLCMKKAGEMVDDIRNIHENQNCEGL